ncbi:type II 3-dehydroquinate dehydratase [Ruminococcus sp.]|uniref:type II 3-dehydroquinate dehydratase n=2 Tax=Ruminococcus sp. TaxID=41978 RepID=UPI0025D7F702|nr:type II 3-dehydroquinate dehydratase [Ruminococcus sp.]MCI5815952.1 type II 3-dehydroquinate dehydratase [Ruminococcus sp.]MDD7555873.1 type II 3-dehydroquinate dehydratase [Ruminococcus sp.]
MRILVIHGPNLNLLGEREPGIYGTENLEQVNGAILARAKELGAQCEVFQSNHEGDIIDRLHEARREFDGVVLNAGAYTHYSYAIRDAIAAIRIPCVEVHISNVHAREEFRHTSVIAPACLGVVCGFGGDSYLLALEGLVRRLSQQKTL